MAIAIAGSGTITGVNAGGLTSASNGRILQVLSATSQTLTSTTSSTYADATGLSVSITPTSSTNKILIIANVCLAVSTNNSVVGGLRIVRDSTAVYTNNNASNIGIGTPLYYNVATNLVYLDSPATTSATTYKIQLARISYAGSYGGTCSVNDSSTNNISSITVYEVAA